MAKSTAIVLFLIGTISAQGQTAFDYYNKANALTQLQRYDEAKSNLTTAIAMKPDYSDAYALRGDCNYYLKLYSDAINDYEKDMTMKKGRSAYSLACTYALAGNKDRAFQSLEEHLASSYKIRMSVILQDKDLEALHSDPRWTALTKKEWYSPYELALFDAEEKSGNGDFAGAIQLATKATSLDSKTAKAYGYRAIYHLRNGDLQKALVDLSEAIRLEPISVYFGNRGYVNNKLGKKTDALNDYEKAIELDPTNLIYYDLAMARFINGNKAGALNAIRKHTQYFTTDEMGFYLAGVITSDSELFDESLNYYNKAIALNNEVPQFYMKRADVYFLLKDYQNAVSNYSTVISLEPSNAEAYYIRGNAKASLIDRDGACADWRKAVSLGFEDSNGYISSLCN